MEEINKQIAELKEKFTKLKSEQLTGTLKNTSEFRKIKKEIARLMTKLSQMNHGA